MSSSAIPIRYFDRYQKQILTEQVYGDLGVRALYGNRLGRLAAEHFFSRREVSQLVGLYHASRLSRLKIPQFVERFGIATHDYEESHYRSFNDFFIRKFKKGIRTFVPDPGALAAFAEARYLGYGQVGGHESIPVKGSSLRPAELLASEVKGKLFEDGPALVARLCPVDYHRFHFPDDGVWVEHYPLAGNLHSVNPLAISAMPTVFETNERQVSVLRTDLFGYIAFIEVGALCVGRIVQTAHVGEKFKRGDEKGYFLFGASTVVVLGEKGAWLPSPDILENSKGGLETFVRLGDRVAERHM